MCTVGAVHNNNGSLYVFKNRDLIEMRKNPDPVISEMDGCKYIKFGIDESGTKPGVWAGVNEHGLSIVGADGNSLINYVGPEYGSGEKTWVAYEEVLAHCKDVAEAYSFITDFYTKNRIGGTGDIIILADRNRSAAIEYTMDLWSIQFNGNTPYTIRTNFFVNLPHIRPKPETSSLHLSSAHRYARALGLLSHTSSDTGLDDVKRILCDRENGPGALSILREGGTSEYKTVCSVIFEITATRIQAHYILNQKPAVDKYQMIVL